MDNRVRDLDQIQEQDTEDGGRRLGTLLLAAAALVGLTFAIGVVVGRAAEPAPQAEDPLARLERNAAVPTPSAPQAVPAPPKVEAADLSFPSTLSEQEERPEVLAALEAAAAEEASLDSKAAPPRGGDAEALAPAGSAEMPSAASILSRDQTPPADEDDGELQQDELMASIPAAVAAGPGARSLPKAVHHDPLVAAALRADESKPPAPRGHDGEYTLQVISFDDPSRSQAFADGLRKKGHEAFVTSADIPERGRYYRVRIGPFKSKEQAEAYRGKFETEEHMNTFVVRLKPEDDA